MSRETSGGKTARLLWPLSLQKVGGAKIQKDGQRRSPCPPSGATRRWLKRFSGFDLDPCPRLCQRGCWHVICRTRLKSSLCAPAKAVTRVGARLARPAISIG